MATDNKTRDPAEIEREIRTTQSEMSRTVDQLEQQLSPRNLMNKMFDQADQNGVDARWMLDQARRNPLAVGLIAAGGLWFISDSDARPSALMPSSGGKSKSDGKSSPEWDDSHYRGYVEHMARIEPRTDETEVAYRRRRDTARGSYLMIEQRHDEDESSYRKRLDQATDKMREERDSMMERARQAAEKAKEQASHLASSAGQQASHLASSAGQQASHLTSGAGHQASHLTSGIGHQASRVAGMAQQTYEQNPLIGGIAAALVGAVLGSTVPVTRTEEEQIGELGSDALDKAKDTAHQAGDQAREKAGQMAEKAREKKDEAVDKADRQMRESGSDAGGSDRETRVVVQSGEVNRV